MRLRLLTLLWVVLTCPSCAIVAHIPFFNHASAPAAKPTMTPFPTLIGSRGEAHPLDEALNLIGFKPFIPQRVTVVTGAVLAPFAGEDFRRNRGLGIEYEAGGRLYALSQWPTNGFTAEGAKPAGSEAGCDISSFRRDGFLWETATRVSTLQPDGTVPPAEVLREARRLIREGACR